MGERAERLKGRLRIESQLSEGTEVNLVILRRAMRAWCPCASGVPPGKGVDGAR